ncbi:hypothetical protein ASPVEDRAFT_32602 [Aspergillus versicolor CBS 583.65]|uniref:Heterokaryon incompatibility domain-containing protein n=1 Tax=Aspergillus versicolor CBS 583.65 TaxID=1036611 RepID=A0A1L9PXN3_ASPVE|nr:uncharacterized protein ASPVEDRAFT_32602 [Aspergillus versicolor CBS 583.65]OJJ06294.1 hypothetical protein ASPVEDRAFT_32602 [Aspergillus versicolor CBS 583.65]
MGDTESASCQACNDISKAFTKDGHEGNINLGSFEQAKASGCPTHTPLLQAFQDLRDLPDSDEVELMTAKKGRSASLRRAGGGPYWDLVLVKKDNEGHIGTGRILNPDWAEAGSIKQWKDMCIESHGPRCDNPMKVQPVRPVWVIDVQKRCLVPGSGPGCDRYIALSYTIEGEEENPGGFKVDDAEMVETLKTPNMIDSPEISQRLPPIIQHAMYLTSALGEHYLWVDALCSLHGDPVNTDAATQRGLRGAIYANALVTIISTDKDSRSGIPGLQGISSPRNLKQRIIPFGDDKIAIRNTGIFSMGAWGAYHKRGWTYQDYKMSARKLMIVNKELHWECQCSVWHEELTPGTEIDQYIDPRLKVILAGFPDLESLVHTIYSYNDREMSHDEDVIPAISSLLSTMSRSFTGGFLYGLPEMLFERALGWSPYWRFTNLRRRTSSNVHLPSWSWIGWQGMVDVGRHEAMRINPLVSDIQETIPITEWYTSKTPAGSPLRRIRSTWFENRESYKDFTKPLPPGWTRHGLPLPDDTRNVRVPKEPYLYPEGCSEYYFKHPKLTAADEHCDVWYYPFPVPDIEPSTPVSMPEQTPYLHCRTKRATLWARVSQERNTNEVDLLNKSGLHVGKLRLHYEDQLDGFPREGTHDIGKDVELVSIYRSWRRERIFDLEKRCYSSLGDPWESYQVLWVEWKDGVAYRLAGGYVRRESWEELDLEDISLVLG